VSFISNFKERGYLKSLVFILAFSSYACCHAEATFLSSAQALCAAPQTIDMAKLSLPMALDHALCVNPSVRQATLLISEKQADIDLAQYGYRPRFNTSVNANASRNQTTSTDNATQATPSLSSSLSLNWLLFDFGQRDATLAQTQAQLDSASFGLSNTQRNAASETIRLYTDALSVWLRLENLRDAEKVAEQSLRAASAKYSVQVGSLSEKLQAQTALSQTSLERVRANGQWETARAALAVHLGFPIYQRIGMPALEIAVPFIGVETNIDDMLQYMQLNHPRLKSLLADANALRNRSSAVAAEGRGTVSFNANAQINRNLNPSNNLSDKNLSASISANIPLFNGDEINARIAQISAQTDTKLSLFDAAKRELEIELLRQLLVVKTEIDAKFAARSLIEAAEQNYKVALGRYLNGVGTIVDLLASQSALSAARLALDISYLNQAVARLRLVATIGRLPPVELNLRSNWSQ
jgi:outer membrane protein